MSLGLAAILCVLFAWAFTEAFAWPVIPDVALASVVFLASGTAAWCVAACVAGSALGGATAISAHRRGLTWPLPLVTPRMRAKVAAWLERGAFGLVHQPLAGVPYKAFVVEGSKRGFGRLEWMVWTVVFRGLRMASIAAIAGAASRGLVSIVGPGDVHAARLIALGVGLAIFLIGWRWTWKIWARDEAPLGHPAGTTTPDVRTMLP